MKNTYERHGKRSVTAITLSSHCSRECEKQEFSRNDEIVHDSKRVRHKYYEGNELTAEEGLFGWNEL